MKAIRTESVHIYISIAHVVSYDIKNAAAFAATFSLFLLSDRNG
jgi:hypothetical protein